MLFTASNRLKNVAAYRISNEIDSHCVVSCSIDQNRDISLPGRAFGSCQSQEGGVGALLSLPCL